MAMNGTTMTHAGWKKTMKRVLQSELTRSILLALILIGVALAGFGVFQYIRLTQAINDNVAYQINAQGQQIDPQSIAEGQALMAASMSLRELDAERDQALILGGAGLVLIAVGWLGRELTGGKHPAPPAPA